MGIVTHETRSVATDVHFLADLGRAGIHVRRLDASCEGSWEQEPSVVGTVQDTAKSGAETSGGRAALTQRRPAEGDLSLLLMRMRV